MKPHLLGICGLVLAMNAGCDPSLPTALPASESESHYVAERRQMVDAQLKPMERGIHHPEVLQAMLDVPRHELVPAKERDHAYEDRPLPIGHGQTISQPYIVAFMTQALDPGRQDRVLEIGTGSGYQAAVLARLVKEVYTIEIVEPLARQAAADLQRLGYKNVHVKNGDGYAGWPEHAPFDIIIVTCAPDHVPDPLTQQLREGGKLIIPVGGGSHQELVLIRKVEGRLVEEKALPVRFVPMTGRAEER